MNGVDRFQHTLVPRLAEFVAEFVPQKAPAPARRLADRRDAADRLLHWAWQLREPAHPLLWLDVPESVGCALMAPVVRDLRRVLRSLQVVLTYSRATRGYRPPGDLIDMHDLRPFETSGTVRHLIRALTPSAIAFVDQEPCPMMVDDASRHRVPTVLLGFEPPAGHRRSWPSKRNTYASIHAGGAATDTAVPILVELGMPPGRVHFTGHPKYDWAWTHATSAGPSPYPVSVTAAARPTLVAGDYRFSDVETVLGGFLLSRREHPSLRLVLGMRDPSRTHVAHLQRIGAAHGFSIAHVNDATGLTDILWADNPEAQPLLYDVATIAYVGGGFERCGPADAAAPAARGRPILFGPYAESPDALALIRSGAASIVKDDWELARRLNELIGDRPRRVAAGTAAQEHVRARLGGARLTTELLMDQLRPALRLVRPGRR